MFKGHYKCQVIIMPTSQPASDTAAFNFIYLLFHLLQTAS